MNRVSLITLVVQSLLLGVSLGCHRDPEDVAAAKFERLGRIVRGEIEFPSPPDVVILVDVSQRIVNGERLAPLRDLPYLQELELQGSTLTDAEMKYLEGLKELRKLHISFTRVTDAGLKHLSGLTQLEVLSLTQCKGVTDAGLEHLAGLKQLRDLQLNGTGVTDAGLHHLKGLSHLKWLTLDSDGKVTESGIIELQKAIPDLRLSYW